MVPDEGDVLEKREVGHVCYIKHRLPAGQAGERTRKNKNTKASNRNKCVSDMVRENKT